MKTFGNGKKMVEPSDIYELFDELSSWEKQEVAERLAFENNVMPEVVTESEYKTPREAFDEYGDDIIEYYDADELIDVLSTKLYDVGLWRLTDLMLAKLRRTNNVEKSWAEEAIGHFQNAINEISKKSGLSIKAETKSNGELKISTINK